VTSTQRCAVTVLLVFVSTPALAQGLVVPPNQLSFGMGVAADGQPVRAPALVFSFAYADSGNSLWPSRFGYVFEGEVNTITYPDSCEDCADAAIWVGTRFHFFRRSGRRVLPFIDLMAGEYWKGEDPSRAAFQMGGGIDLLRSASLQGLRFAVDYRRVLADPDWNQIRFVTSYVIGPSSR